jgi:hypothetical protein
MQPSGSVTKIIRRLTAAGVASTGKVTGDFTFTAYHKPNGGATATYTHGSVITELASGYYDWTYSAPSTAGQYGIDCVAASGTDVVYNVMESGELESNDLDSIYAIVARPIVTVSGQGTIGQITPLTLVNKRYREVIFQFVDDAGTNINMTTGVNYTAYTFGVRDRTDDTLTPPKVDAVNGTTTTGFTYVIAGSDGAISVKIPEDATFFTLTEGASSSDILELRYELTGDLIGATSGCTVSLVQSSPLYLVPRKVGT